MFKVQKYVANAIGFTTAATSNYIFNRIWTFQSHNPRYLQEFSRFFVIALIGLGINSLIIWAMSGKFKVNFYRIETGGDGHCHRMEFPDQCLLYLRVDLTAFLSLTKGCR